MKANQLATLVLRLLGIYCLTQVLPLIPIFSAIVLGGMHGASILTAVGAIAGITAYLAVGILLIIYSVPWGQKLISTVSSDETISAISFGQAQALAFAVLGILIFAGALPDLFTSIFDLLHSFSPEDQILNNLSGSARPDSYIIEHAVGTLLKAALGAWLFFGVNGFVNFFGVLRNFATPKPPQT